MAARRSRPRTIRAAQPVVTPPATLSMRTKLLDLVERAVWTGLQAFGATVAATDIVSGHVRWEQVIVSAAIAGGLAAAKVISAQNFSANGLGDALPGAEVVPAAQPKQDGGPAA